MSFTVLVLCCVAFLVAAGSGSPSSFTSSTSTDTLCYADEYVQDRVCVPCPPGTTNDKGDDARGGDTTCHATFCAADEFVSSHVCVPCPPNSTNVANDDASGPDTSCDGYGRAESSDIIDCDGNTITMRIRDFSVNFIDMEVPTDCPGRIIHKNMVEDELSASGTPVWVARTGTDHVGCTHSKDDFDMWFVDCDANQQMDIDVFMVQEEANVFTYEESNFIPCDGQLGGNEDMTHNYFFTGAITGQTFEYNLGDYVSVCGSDDLWLFIDGQLVVDIGGVHPTGCDDVDLDQLGLTGGSEYSFDLFYAQRTSNHTGSLHITTSFPLGECAATCPGTELSGSSDNICELSALNNLVDAFQEETVVSAPFDTSTCTLEDDEPTDGSMSNTEWFQFQTHKDCPLTNPWYCVSIEADDGAEDVLLRLYQQDDDVCTEGTPDWAQLTLVAEPDRGSAIECFAVKKKKYYWLQVDSEGCGSVRFSRYTEDTVPASSSAALLEFETGEFVESHRLPVFIEASSGDGVDSDSLSESIDPRTLGLAQDEASSGDGLDSDSLSESIDPRTLGLAQDEASSGVSSPTNGRLGRLRGSQALNPM